MTKKMRLGIDIDGTLNDFYSFLVDYGSKYSVENDIGWLENPEANMQTDMYGWSWEVGKAFWEKYAFVEMFDFPARVFAAEVLRKLQQEGKEIWIITVRSNSDTKAEGMNGRSWEEITKAWLKREQILYDEIAFSVTNKAEFCKENDVDVMVEDNPRFMGDFQGRTKLLIYDAPYNRRDELKYTTRVYSWYDAYRKIQRLEVR